MPIHKFPSLGADPSTLDTVGILGNDCNYLGRLNIEQGTAE